MQQCEVHALYQGHETRASVRGTQQPCVSQASLPRCDNWQRESRVSSQQRRQTRVLEPQRKSCFHEIHVSEPCVFALRSKENSRKLKSPRQSTANLFDPPPTDLRDYLTWKRNASLITLSCCYERLITMLSECRCSSRASRQSRFKLLTLALRLAKRNSSHKRRTFSDTEYPEITANMTSRSRESNQWSAPTSLTQNQKESTGILALGLE